jgi:uncharacterized membrane protein
MIFKRALSKGPFCFLTPFGAIGEQAWGGLIGQVFFNTAHKNT